MTTAMFPSVSLYTINFPRYWFVREEGAKVYLPAQEEGKSSHKSMLFHVKAGDYITTLASILRFFEETIHDDKVTPEMRELQLKSIREVMDDLLYLNKDYVIVPKKPKE